jgi:flagellar biogenesis protein FliO
LANICAAAIGDPAANRPLAADAPASTASRITAAYDNQKIRPEGISAAPANKAGDDTSDNDSSSFEVPRILAATALVVCLIFLLRWVARRFGAAPAPNGTRAVQVVSRSVIAPRQSVVLMRVGRRVLVVADNGTQLSSLGEISDPDEVAALIGQVQGEKIDLAGRTFGAFIGRFKRDEKDELVASSASGSLEMSSEISGESVEPAASDGSDVSSARAQLSGLMEQVRLVSSQFNRT